VAVMILISGAVTVTPAASRPCDSKLACRDAEKFDVSLAAWLAISKICVASFIGATIS